MNAHGVPEISPADLVAEVERGSPLHLLDVRDPERVAAGRIDVVAGERFHNIPGSELISTRDPASLGLDPAVPLAVSCTRGRDSLVIAGHLRRLGFDAFSVSGGILGWMATVIPRELALPDGLDHLVQLDRIGKGALGYLLASAGEAVVIDPGRHAATVLEQLATRNLRPVAVADTHVHADYLSGGPGLAHHFGVPYRIHPRDAVSPYDGRRAAFAFEPLGPAEPLRFGRAALTVEETPGHTEGSVTFRFGDALALTGDFLFVDSLGRPDLGGKTEEWARELWASLERARRDWPPALRILPAHYASDDERNPDRTVDAPLAEVRARNAAFASGSFEELLAAIQAANAEVPDAYRRIKTANLGLARVSAAEADELEAGRNQCALG
jgi:glyoxylase-like metal-dependent hydrolase (beta-lactamase superfamily II)